MQQVILGGHSGSLNTGATRYIYPYGEVNGGDATIANRTVLIPEAGTISKLRVLLDGTAGAAKSYTFTMYVNGSPSALTCAVSGGTDVAAEDVANSVSVAAGDRLSLEYVPAGTPTARVLRFAYVYTPTTSGIAVLLGGATSNPSTSATRYMTLGNCEASWDATQTNRAAVWNIDATIKTLYVFLTAAPGAGKNRVFTIMKNGSAEASSAVTIADAATSGSVTGLTIDLAPGDTLSLRTVPSGTPTATAVYWAMSYAPDVDGQYCMTGVDQNAIGVGSRYNSLTQYPISWDSIDGSRPVKAGASTGLVPTIKSIRALLSAAPGVGTSRTFTVGVDAAASALAVTISDANTTGVASTDVTPTLDQLVNIEQTVSGSPASAFASVAVLLAAPAGGGGGGGLGHTLLPLLGVG